MDETFDFVVVGGGSAGCVAASVLGQRGARVVVLECGDSPERNPEAQRADRYDRGKRALVKGAFVDDALMWDRFTVPQTGCDGHRVYVGSGRGLGGGGSVDAMVYTRGDARDYDGWALRGWGWDDVVPDFERIEATLGITRRDPTLFTEACIRAAEETGFRRKVDLDDGDLCEHVGYEWMSQRDGERRSSYVAFLRPAVSRGEVEVRTLALVRRVLFEGARATGVEVELGDPSGGAPVRRRIGARGAVVLCAGALETPKLLMVSGVGPASILRTHGIEVRAELPVGNNLHDHPNVTLFYLGSEPADTAWTQLYGFHRANPTSALGPGQADTCYVFYTARSSLREVAQHLAPSLLLPESLYARGPVGNGLRALLAGVLHTPPADWLLRRMWGIVVILGKPRSRGTVRLRSNDAADPAIVDPGYLSHPEDLETMVAAVRHANAIAAAPPLQRWGNRVLDRRLRREASDETIASLVRGGLMTTYHYAGTCRMGDGDGSVVDPRLHVRGLEGLVVADASVLPTVPVAALSAPSMLVGYRAGTMLATGDA